MCVGPPDSGKTTWIVPILEVINRQHLATCTDEGKFSCQSLTSLTEMLWLEEWELGITLVTNCLFGCLCVCVCMFVNINKCCVFKLNGDAFKSN